jgi:hypothetical protein
MADRDNRLVEAVVINWKRPRNVAAILSALRRQTFPCTVTVCDCHDAPEFALAPAALASADRVYRWQHNTGAFSRYVPVGAYDHEYTFFLDDDMLPGERCVEHFLTWAETLRAFGALGQMGRILDPGGRYRPHGVPRSAGFTEVDVLVRAFFVPTSRLSYVHQARALLEEFGDPEDDILLSVGMSMCGGLGCYLTPVDSDPQTLVNLRELDTPHARSSRPAHGQARSRLVESAIGLGWRPIRRRGRPGPAPGTESGVLYLAIGAGYRDMTVASVAGLRRYGYYGPVRVVTDEPGWMPARLGCETVLVPGAGTGFAARHYKTRLLEYAYDLTLFLDCDTVPVGNIGSAWGLLGDRDIAMAADLRPDIGDLIVKTRNDRSRDEYDLMIRLGMTGHAFFNSGVMLFRRSNAVAALFTAWHQEWQRFRKRDQMALARAIALTRTTVGTLPVMWNCPSRDFASIRDAQDARVRILHFFSSNRKFLTVKLLSVLSDERSYPAGGEWERWDLCDRRRLEAGANGAHRRASQRGRGGGFLAQTAIGVAAHLELAIPGASGVDNYWRPQEMPDDTWYGPIVAGEAAGAVDSASLIQGDLGNHGNLEMVVRAGDQLGHCWRPASPRWPWRHVTWFAGGAAGNPSLIQSDCGRGGSLDLVVPRASGGLAHYRRDNGVATRPWVRCAVFAAELGRVDAAALIQSDLGDDGSLEVIARIGDRLAHYQAAGPGGQAWAGPTFFFSGAAGNPGFIQNKHGAPGRFEVLTPLRRGGMAHLWRDNADPARPWHVGAYIDRGGASVVAVSLLQSSYRFAGQGHLEAAVLSDTDVTWYWRDDRPPGRWSCVRL